MKKIKKLIVKEFTITEKQVNNPKAQLLLGDKYSYFEDPKTGKCYRPIGGFTVTSDTDLMDRFVEVESWDEDAS